MGTGDSPSNGALKSPTLHPHSLEDFTYSPLSALPEDAKEHLLAVTRIFESIDRLVLEKLAAANGYSTHVINFVACRPPNILQYLAEYDSITFHWRESFRIIQISLTTGVWPGSIVDFVGAYKRVEKLYLALLDALEMLKEQGSEAISAEITLGVQQKKDTMLAFLEAADMTYDAYRRYNGSTNHPSLSQLSRLRKISTPSEEEHFNSSTLAGVTKKAVDTKLSLLLNAITRHESLITIASLVSLICAIVQSISFAKSPQYTQPIPISDPSFLTAFQQALMQILGLFLTLTPVLRDIQLGAYFGVWTWSFTLLSFVSAILSVVLVPFVPSTWPAMLSFVSTVLQVFVGSQLVFALNAAETKRAKSS